MAHINTSDTIRLVKDNHRGDTIILFQFRGRRDWLNTIKKLQGIKFSRTKGYWYIPYQLDAYNSFIGLGIPYTLPSTHVEEEPSTELPDSDHDKPGIDINTDVATTSFSTGQKNVDIQANQSILVTWNSSKFSIQMKYDHKNVAFVKTLEAAWWNQKSVSWICKASIRNLEKIQERWNVWDVDKYDKIYQQIGMVSSPCKLSLYYSPKYKDEVCLKLIGFGANHQFLKTISGRTYHKKMKIYTVPAKRAVVDSIISYYKGIGYPIDNRLSVYAKKEAPVSTSKKLDLFLNKFDPDQYTVLKKMVSLMHRQGYGVSTIKDYCGKLARIMEYHKTSDLDALSITQIHDFIDYLQDIGISFSLVNKVYSAVKLYFKNVAPHDDFPIERLKRPRKKFVLPKFLSESELIRLLDQVENVKHLAILYLLYGSGLRKGEVLNLKLEHVYWDRGQLFVSHAKGGKDRMVNLSVDTKIILEGYFHNYMPQIYLFEGNRVGKQYSKSSIAKIVHNACKRANISKRVTPHMLRHSFATHLMDNGTSLPKIQQLLGHKDIKTTLIYTHVSNSDIQNVKSPLDFLKKKSPL